MDNYKKQEIDNSTKSQTAPKGDTVRSINKTTLHQSSNTCTPRVEGQLHGSKKKAEKVLVHEGHTYVRHDRSGEVSSAGSDNMSAEQESFLRDYKRQMIDCRGVFSSDDGNDFYPSNSDDDSMYAPRVRPIDSVLNYSGSASTVDESDIPENFEFMPKTAEWKKKLYRNLDNTVKPVIEKYGKVFNEHTQTSTIKRKAKLYFDNIVMYNGVEAFEAEIKRLISFMPRKITFDMHFWYGFFYSIYRIVRFESGLDLILSLTNLVNTFLMSTGKRHLDSVHGIVNDFLKSFSEGRTYSESLPDYDVKFSLVEYIKIGLDCKVVASLRTFILNMVGLRFFNKDLALSFISALGPAEPVSLLDFSINILSLIEDMVHVIGDLASGKGIVNAFCASDPIAKWMEHASDLSSKYRNVYLGADVNFPHLIESGMISAKQYLKDVDEAIKVGRNLKSSKKAPSMFNSRINQLIEIRTTVFARMAGCLRMAPLGVIISGPPSVGKSSLIDHISKIYCKHNELEFTKDIIYHKPSNSRHWTNYSPATQPIIHYSELGSLHKNIAAKSGDETINELLNVLDSQPYQVEMADIESKGKVFVMANLVLMDVNDPDLNLDVIQNNPAAVRRRFLYIHVDVKKEYRKSGATELDKSKIDVNIVDKMDLWDFKIYSMVASGIKTSIRVDYINPDNGTHIFDIFSLSTFFLERMKLHALEQEKYKVAVSEDISKYLQPRIKAESIFELLGVRAEEDILEEGIEEALERDSIPADEDRLSLSHRTPLPYDNDSYRTPLIGDYLRPQFERHTNGVKPGGLLDHHCDQESNRENIKALNWDYFKGGLATTVIGTFLFVPHMYFIGSLPLFYATFFAGRIAFTERCFCNDFPWYKKITYYGLDKCSTLWLEVNAFMAIRDVHLNPNSKWAAFGWCLNVPRYLLHIGINHKDNWLYRWSADLLMFMFLLILIRLFLRVWKFFTHSVEAESELIQSTGDFKPADYKDKLAHLESTMRCEFPAPRKKNYVDKDYDNIESFVPRIITEEVAYNKPEEVVSAVTKNIRYFKVKLGDKSATSMGVGVYGDYMLMNYHNFVPNGTLLMSKSKEVAINVTVHHLEPCMMRFLGDDICVVRVIGCMFKDIRGTLADLPSFMVSLKGYINNVEVNVLDETLPITVMHNLTNYVVKRPLKYDLKEHYKGLCGCPLVLTINKQTVFAGLHTAGTDSTIVYATRVSKKQILEAIKNIRENSLLAPVFSEGALRLVPGTSIGKISTKSPLLFEDVRGLNVAGSIVPYKNVTPRTTIIPSPLLGHIKDLIGENPYLPNGELKYLPPMMRSKRINGNFISPSNIWMKKVGVVKMPLHVEIMEKTVFHLTTHLIDRLRQKGIIHLTPYPLSVAQNGYPENIHIRAMKNSTSGGFLLPGKKSKYNTPISYDFKSDSVEPKFEIVEQVLETYASYYKNENAHTIVGAQMKDEPRPYDKVKSGKTRIFAMSSYDSTLVQRSILMPFYALMCSERDSFCTKVGINMHSSEADEMYHKLKEFSPYIMEGDYGGYDTSMPVGIGLITNSVVTQILKKLGYNESALNKAEGILSDNLFPTVCMEGNVFIAPGFQPSGKYATAEDNSLRGLVLLYYAFICMCTPDGIDHPANYTTDFKARDFFDLLLPITYGDDMLCGVKPVLARYFNNITYCYFVETVYKMEFTSSDKTEQQHAFIDIDSISFLKRKFVHNKMLGRIVAQLDMESLVKSLMYILPSKEVSLETQIVETSASALREIFFHCDSPIHYEVFRANFVIRVTEVTGFKKEDVENFFPTGNQLLDQYF